MATCPKATEPTADQPLCQCWCYDVLELYDEAVFNRAMALLPWSERRAKVERFVFQKDKCLCLGAGLLLSFALRKAGVRDFALGYGAHNKPHLLNCSNVHFNLSHSGAWAVCAVSSDPVGIDVEERRAYDDGVARLCFTANELAWMERQDDVPRAFARLWTRKESYVKLLGTGLSKSPNSFEAMPGTQLERSVSFCEYELPGCAVCVCARHRGGPGGSALAGAHDSGGQALAGAHDSGGLMPFSLSMLEDA